MTENKLKLDDHQKEELRKRIAADLGNESIDIPLDSILGAIILDSTGSDTPKVHPDGSDSQNLIIALFPNVPNLRGKYAAEMKNDRLTIFRAGSEEILATYTDPQIRTAYNEIFDDFYPGEK